MLKNERFEKILKSVNENHYVSLKDLMNILSSSESTVRADLVELERDGKLKRIHGGAESIESESDFIAEELSIKDKEMLEKDAKEKIAQEARKFALDGNFIYIDAGTTTNYLAKVLTLPKATFVTNSAIIGRTLVDNGNKVYMIGGTFKGLTDAFVGAFTIDNLEKFNFDIGFFGTNGVDHVEGLTTPDLEEAMVKRVAVKRSKKVFILADHTKFNVITATKFADIENVTVITDKCEDERYKKFKMVEAE